MTKTVMLESPKPVGCSNLQCPSRQKCKRPLFLDAMLPFHHNALTGKCPDFIEIDDDTQG